MVRIRAVRSAGSGRRARAAWLSSRPSDQGAAAPGRRRRRSWAGSGPGRAGSGRRTARPAAASRLKTRNRATPRRTWSAGVQAVAGRRGVPLRSRANCAFGDRLAALHQQACRAGSFSTTGGTAVRAASRAAGSLRRSGGSCSTASSRAPLGLRLVDHLEIDADAQVVRADLADAVGQRRAPADRPGSVTRQRRSAAPAPGGAGRGAATGAAAPAPRCATNAAGHSIGPGATAS